MIQTGWQHKMYQKYSSAILCIDATHNVTMYEHLNLTTLVVRDFLGSRYPNQLEAGIKQLSRDHTINKQQFKGLARSMTKNLNSIAYGLSKLVRVQMF
jgi:hypothetical protein